MRTDTLFGLGSFNPQGADRCRSGQSLWCRSVPISAATISRFRHLTAPNGTQRHLSAPKTFFQSAPGSCQLSWNGFTIPIPCASGKNPARSGPPIADRCPQTATRHSSSCPNPQLDIARHSSRSDQLKSRAMSTLFSLRSRRGQEMP